MELSKACTEVSLDQNSTLLRIKIPAKLDYCSTLRDYIGSRIFQETDFSEKWRHRIQLIADELINNAIEHGSSPGDAVQIELRIHRNSDIILSVEDLGRPANPIVGVEILERAKKNREMMLADFRSNRTIRGRGIALIALNWSDELSYEVTRSGGTKVTMVKRFTPDCAR